MTTSSDAAALAPASRPAQHFMLIDDLLGPREHRFFGDGFRRVGTAFGEVSIDATGQAGAVVRAIARLSYPPTWSVKAASGELVPHLSTVDAFVLAVQLAESYLVHVLGLDSEQRARIWVRRAWIKAGTSPQNDLTACPMTLTQSSSVIESDSLCGGVSTFQCTVGTIKVRLEVEHPGGVAESVGASGHYATAETLLGSAESRHFGNGYKRRSHVLTDLVVDACRVSGMMRCELNGDDDRGTGLASRYQPFLSPVDCIIAGAQFAQALMYHIDGLDRARTQTLWMRNIAIAAKTPYQPVEHPFGTQAIVSEAKTITLGGVPWRTATLTGLFQGVELTASLAHALPPLDHPQAKDSVDDE